MSNEIINTYDIADAGEFEVESDIVATEAPEERGIEFHVSMRNYTQRDMEILIIEAAATQIVGRRGDHDMAKAIEQKCVELINEKATAALSSVTAEIIDQPMTPAFGDKKPVTMREFLALYGREYLTERVDRDGKPCSVSYGSNTFTRIEFLVSKYMDRKFKSEIEAATSAAIREIQAAINAQHNALLTAAKARLREALAKATAQ